MEGPEALMRFRAASSGPGDAPNLTVGVSAENLRTGI
jgi:hypothetical protein